MAEAFKDSPQKGSHEGDGTRGDCTRIDMLKYLKGYDWSMQMALDRNRSLKAFSMTIVTKDKKLLRDCFNGSCRCHAI